jgi:hypothetical protein
MLIACQTGRRHASHGYSLHVFMKPMSAEGGPTSVQPRDRVPPTCALLSGVNPFYLE